MPDMSVSTVGIIVLAVVIFILIFRRGIKARSGPKSNSADAQRFARLLIAEIKLYDEQRLETARTEGNIYRELKPEIDRARKMYEKRFAFREGIARDYFHEELVNSLAGGDPTKLGPGYDQRGTVH
jgi:hypothetical protein